MSMLYFNFGLIRQRDVALRNQVFTLTSRYRSERQRFKAEPPYSKKKPGFLLDIMSKSRWCTKTSAKKFILTNGAGYANRLCL